MIFNFKMTGHERFNALLQNLEYSVKDLQPLFKEFAIDFRKTMEKVFKNNGAFDGRKRWASLSDETFKDKKKAIGNRAILVWSGDLRTSLTKSGGRNIELISNNGVQLGTRDSKAHYHQTGTNKMPERTLIEFTASQEKRWYELAEKYFKRRSGTGL